MNNNGSGKPSSGLYAVKQTKIEKLPFAEDIEEYMPECYYKIYTDSTKDEFDSKRDISFKNMDDLVPLFYERQEKPCPIEIRPFDELLEQTLIGVDGEKYFIDGYESYMSYYGIEWDNIYWIRSVPVFACVATSNEQAEQFVADYKDILIDPKIVPIEAGELIAPGHTAQFPF